MSRAAKVCGACFNRIRPTEYEPNTFNDGVCDACGIDAFVHRVTRAEVNALADWDDDLAQARSEQDDL